uniref:Uncharacterized protein n=1 Tax=Chenopodium quinoa TaxID=63459 RepID=A0A803LRK7_CHEQI
MYMKAMTGAPSIAGTLELTIVILVEMRSAEYSEFSWDRTRFDMVYILLRWMKLCETLPQDEKFVQLISEIH